MTFELLLSLIGLALAAAWTPGPNNVLVASSGARYGMRRTVPHIAGIGVGFPLMIFVIAVGLGQVFQQSQLLRETVRIIGIIVLLWLAWRIASSTAKLGENSFAQPFTFLQSAAFQWINPKAWVMAIGVTAQFVSQSNPIQSSLIISSVFVFAGFTSASGWAFFGVALRNWLNTRNRLRIFNIFMALLIVASIGAIALSELH